MDISEIPVRKSQKNQVPGGKRIEGSGTYHILPRSSVGSLDFDMKPTAVSPSMYPCFHGSSVSKYLSELIFSAGDTSQFHSGGVGIVPLCVESDGVDCTDDVLEPAGDTPGQ